jgi:lipoprotein-releasing system permease protein
VTSTAWWLAYRYFGSFKRFFSLSTTLAILGMAIGVASLVVSMAVFTGYNSTLEKTVQDAVGHVLVLKRGNSDQEAMLKEIQPYVKGLVASTPFVYSEGILAHQGKISGVLIEGVDLDTVNSVLNLKDRLVAGKFDLSPSGDDEPKALIGKGIAKKFGLKVGDVFRIVVPLANEYQAASFRPKLGKFRITGIVNFGRYDFDTKYVVMAIEDVQKFVEIKKNVTGYRLRIEDPYKARAIANEITARFGSGYWARDWQEVNRNLFEAAKLEKAVLFCVLMILVVAAAFNIANTLFVSVVQRYRDISVLKTLGASDRLIRRVFTAQGLIVGAVGASAGVIIGLLLCRLVEWAQVYWQLIPAEVYKLDHITLDVQISDLVVIVGVSLAICFLATLVPSRRGAKISPVEGLRYE